MTSKVRPTRVVARETTPAKPPRKILEKVFFHDILNLASGVQGMMEVMSETEDAAKAALRDSVQAMADQLVDEIIAHRDFLCAESGDLEVEKQPLRSDDLLHGLRNLFRSHPLAATRTIWLDPEYASFIFHSDQRVISRVLINMLKNALEATADGDVITVSCGESGQDVWFSVHNSGVIPEDVRAGIFEPSFSSKGAGRGLGTYSMRLLSETYLGGRIGFQSDPAAGTVFKVSLPVGGP